MLWFKRFFHLSTELIIEYYCYLLKEIKRSAYETNG